VTELGQQMQISRYLGHGASGIYTIDYEKTPQPNMPEKRNQALLSMIESSQGFGPDTSLPGSEWEQRTYWLRNRWPRVIFQNSGEWELILQWAIRDNVVIQQCVLRNFTETILEIDYSIVLDVLIRELDFAKSFHSFNDETNKDYVEGPGPGGYGFVKLYRLTGPGDHQNDHGDNAPSSDNSSRNLNPDAVAAVMGVFVNGEALTKDKFDHDRSITIAPRSVYSIVSGYKLVLLSTKRENWKSLLLTKEDVDIDDFLWKTQPPADIPPDTFLFNEPFYIGRNVEHILTVCAIPVTEGPVWDYKTRSTRDVGEETKPPVIALTCGDMAGHRVCSSAS
jgi:hypothetical protein